MSPESEDNDRLGEAFRRRLREELDEVMPLSARPRYLASSGRTSVSAWRLTPAALAAAITGILALTAYATTGSPNPVVWTQRIVSGIESGPAVETNTPTPAVSGSGRAVPPAPTDHDSGAPKAEPTESPEPTEEPEPSSSPEPTESPEPSGGDHSGSGGGSGDSGGYGSSGSGQPSPSPSPSPSDH